MESYGCCGNYFHEVSGDSPHSCWTHIMIECCYHLISNEVALAKPKPFLIVLYTIDLFFNTRVGVWLTGIHSMLSMWQSPNCLISTESFISTVKLRQVLDNYVSKIDWSLPNKARWEKMDEETQNSSRAVKQVNLLYDAVSVWIIPILFVWKLPSTL